MTKEEYLQKKLDLQREHYEKLDNERKLKQVEKDHESMLKQSKDRSRRLAKSVANSAHAPGLFKIVICALLLGALFAVMTGSEIPTFAGFLEALQTAPSIPIDRLVTLVQGLPTIGGDWEVLDGLRQFINQIIELTSDVYSVLMYFVFSLYNFLLMAMWALRWLFGLM